VGYLANKRSSDNDFVIDIRSHSRIPTNQEAVEYSFLGVHAALELAKPGNRVSKRCPILSIVN
jgi:hypothetical protein